MGNDAAGPDNAARADVNAFKDVTSCADENIIPYHNGCGGNVPKFVGPAAPQLMVQAVGIVVHYHAACPDVDIVPNNDAVPGPETGTAHPDIVAYCYPRPFLSADATCLPAAYPVDIQAA